MVIECKKVEKYKVFAFESINLTFHKVFAIIIL